MCVLVTVHACRDVLLPPHSLQLPGWNFCNAIPIKEKKLKEVELVDLFSRNIPADEAIFKKNILYCIKYSFEM